MNNVILPFLMSMLLGRTIDLSTYTISGMNVFDDQDYEEVPVGSLQTTYNVVQEDAFPYSFFGIPADVVLRVKAGLLSALSGALGLDGALKDTAWKYGSVVVSATTIYRTVDRTLRSDAVPVSEWATRVPPSQTHYARSLFYGGWYVVLFRFQCDVPSDIPLVRKLLTDHLGVVGVLSNDTVRSWERAIAALKTDTDIRGNVKITTHVYSTTPLETFITSPETLLQAISSLPAAVGPVGQPLYMELKPLNDLSPRFPIVKENIKMLSDLEKMDEIFDDVKLAKSRMMKWISETLETFEDEEEEKIADLLENLNGCIRSLSRLSSEVSLFKEVDRKSLDSAFKQYQSGLPHGISSYNLAFRRLKEDIDAECEDAFHAPVRGLLRVYDSELERRGELAGGLGACQAACTSTPRCRAMGYANQLSELDLGTGEYFERRNQCWIYYRSTSTAHLNTPSGMSGDFHVYDRKCY